MRADGLVLKATFVYIDNGVALVRKAIIFNGQNFGCSKVFFWLMP